MTFKNKTTYDKEKMLKIYDKWPEFAERSFKKFSYVSDYKNIDHIVFCGMGGSGALGDVFASILSKTKIHTTIVKGYTLPNTVSKNSLVIIVSVSGNTVETLSILNEAIRLDCKIIGFSSGGRVEKICKINNLKFFKIKMEHSPRASFILYLFSMLKILQKLIKLKNEDIIEAIQSLKKIRDENNSNKIKNNHAINLSKTIKGIPLIYYPYGLQSAAIRFKNSLQENGKIHTISEDIIEACHNGIVAWERDSNVQPILIQGFNDYIKTKERWTILKKYFKDNGINFTEIKSVKGSILSKIVNLIYFLDYVSIYYAIENRIDPTPVKSIEYIKKNLN